MHSEVNELLGDIEYSEQSRQYDAAFELYKYALKVKPSNTNLYIKMGKCREK